ncbi:hypothetical protein [Polaribacter ponticola]|uniref:Clp ATPase C-terminal domain-containing protein n=1 Tax=Polaribacter ponticola TaxID=2978475 RepID=A0ABT5S7P0_9FLAO|nr:hypothetical protein [Polaribacter sp. MSW5]MDD7914121.1 hypothetical protein [Polaribacter sp. MSW5]
METNLAQLKNEFKTKTAVLENARITLKQEFIGIDEPINAIIDNMNSWFTLSKIQERPLVINLWGLTGVGKTSLIKRLIKLIDLENIFYRLDLGQTEGKNSITRSLSDLCENSSSAPVIIALDEFQHTRTLEGPFRKEKEDKNRVIWELLDSGIIQHDMFRFGVWRLQETAQKLQHLLAAGITVKNGKVTNGKDLFFDETDTKESKSNLFLDVSNYEFIIELAGNVMGFHLKSDVEKVVLKMNGEETIQFLKKVVSNAQKPVKKDFSKALIFVLGNLDEAFTMSGDYAMDIDADDFYKSSKKITIFKIKKALKARFRDEQIARLGNIHVIYPSLHKKAYQKIIENELVKVSDNILKMTDIKLEFGTSIIQLIYNEGVYPTMGVRPVLTTINHLIKSKISVIISEIFNQNKDVNRIQINYEEADSLKCDYKYEKTVLFHQEFPIELNIQKNKSNKKDDMQSIVAVHESGHAILAALLMKTVPKYVYSNSVDDNFNGFVLTQFKWKYFSKKELIPRVAMILGGIAAEELIFGEENKTAGSENDIEKATEMILTMLKKADLEAQIYLMKFLLQIPTYIYTVKEL